MAQTSLNEFNTQFEGARGLKLQQDELSSRLDSQMNRRDELISWLIKHLRSVKPQRATPHPSPLTHHR